MSIDMATRVFRALKEEPLLDSVHLAGGEAGMRFDHLVEVVELAVREGIPLSYLETNASWCADRAVTRRKLGRLREAGLPAILVSASPFHNEFIPFDRTRTCVEEGAKVFGRGGVIVWVPEFYGALSRLPDPGTTRSVESFCEAAGIPMNSRRLPDLYYLTPGGRVPEALGDCYQRRPADAYRHEACAAELASTGHFHIDSHGNLFTGLCPGIAPGNANNLHPDITPETFPVFCALWDNGPFGLLERFGPECAADLPPEGLISKCDLCFRMRRALATTGRFAELRPLDYYAGDAP
jgi:hypothetical protein